MEKQPAGLHGIAIQRLSRFHTPRVALRTGLDGRLTAVTASGQSAASGGSLRCLLCPCLAIRRSPTASRASAWAPRNLLPSLYDDWVLEARARLERDCADLWDRLCTALAKEGDLTEAARAARRRIELQPLEEAAYRVLMQLQADLGDRAGAVSTYHHCASVLERELGIIPDPATRLMFERLLTDVDLADSPPAGAGRAHERTGKPARLVSRSAELSALQDLWRAAVAGQPGLVLVRGPAGVGKTRLVTELADLAHAQGGRQQSVLRPVWTAGARAGRRLAPESGSRFRDQAARRALARRSRTASAGPAARRTSGSPGRLRRCVARPPLVRGTSARAARRRASDAGHDPD
jgi:Bacterial transcriptional activator domain/AAA ATPase domain